MRHSYALHAHVEGFGAGIRQNPPWEKNPASEISSAYERFLWPYDVHNLLCHKRLQPKNANELTKGALWELSPDSSKSSLLLEYLLL
jgi:hypothetical protein